MKVAYKKQWLWECECVSNGYENTKEEAKESVRLHKEVDHRVKHE